MAKDTCPINRMNEIEFIHKMCFKTDSSTVYANTT